MQWILIFVGAGLGGMARHGMIVVAARMFGPSFPYGTMAVNIAGSAIVGVLFTLLSSRPAETEALRLFFVTGLMGGFTTFSAFSLDTLLLWQRGQTGAAVSYVAATLLLSLGAVAVAALVTRRLIG